ILFSGRRGLVPGRGGRRRRGRMPQELRDDGDDGPLQNAGRDERGLVAVVADRRLDEWNEQRRTAAEAGRHDASGEPAPLLEPFQRRSDRAAVDERRAGAGQAVEHVEHRQGRGIAYSGPAEAAHEARRRDETAWPDTIDQPAVERLHPGLKDDEQRERELDVGELPARAFLQWTDEERPR